MDEDVLTRLSSNLRLSASRREQILREVRSHLEACQLDLQLSGETPEEARRKSELRFGDPEEIGGLLSSVYRRRAIRPQMVLLAVAVVMAFSAWFGTNHTLASSNHGLQHRSSSACVYPDRFKGQFRQIRTIVQESYQSAVRGCPRTNYLNH